MKNKSLIHQSVIKLTCSAILAAACVVLAIAAKSIFTSSPLRLTIENLPVFMASFFFGPFWGFAVAVCADLLSCVMSGMAPYPLITIGAAVIGATSGILYNFILKKAGSKIRIVVSVIISHILGSMIIKTAALWLLLSSAGITLLLRIPVYIGISIIESAILIYLTKSKALMDQIKKIKGEK